MTEKPTLVVYITEAEWQSILPEMREAQQKSDHEIATRALARIIGEDKANQLRGTLYGLRIVEDLLRQRVEPNT